MDTIEYDFAAKEPALGYFYQIQYGLYLLLNSSHDNTNLLIESLDDIEIQSSGNSQIIQTKYHFKTNVKLTDRSSDFWKTMRVWCEQICNNLITIDSSVFSLITTQKVSDGSVLSNIKNKSQADEIIKILCKIANETTNIKNKKGYDAFNRLLKNQQKDLIEKINIIDASLDFEDIEIKIKKILRFSVLPNQITPMLERLEGWFLLKCIGHLKGTLTSISFDEVQSQILHIKDSFMRDNLPIDFPDKIIPSNNELRNIDNMIFVRQLGLIDASIRLKGRAISDYYRAFNQRSKWIKEDLLNPQEEIDFDNKLFEDWERKFDLLLDENELNSPDVKVINGNLFYKSCYVEKVPNTYIRNRFQESYLTLGSCHMLSNKAKIGWNPDFVDLLSKRNDS